MPAHRRGRCALARTLCTCPIGRAWGLLVIAVIVSAPGLALAQPQDSDAEEEARFHWGPLALTPTFTIPTIGVDSNVFNEQEDPKSDFIMSVEPAADYWLRMGRGRLSARSVLNYEFFKEDQDQRSLGGEQHAKLEFMLERVAPFVAGTYVNSKVRNGFEVDLRARRKETMAEVGAAVRLSQRTELVVSANRTFLEHDATSFLGVNLKEAHDRTSENGNVSFRYEVTPLTTLVVESRLNHDRFDFSTFRDTDGLRVLSGLELDRSALIHGRAVVGVASVKTLDAAVRDFSGIVAMVDVSCDLRGTTFQGRVQRDVFYSFEPVDPFYVQTGFGVTARRRLNPRWDALGRVDRYKLDYDVPDRRPDMVMEYGVGFGYYLRPTLRIGFDAAYTVRESAIMGRNYDRVLLGPSVIYGAQR